MTAWKYLKSFINTQHQDEPLDKPVLEYPDTYIAERTICGHKEYCVVSAQKDSKGDLYMHHHNIDITPKGYDVVQHTINDLPERWTSLGICKEAIDNWRKRREVRYKESCEEYERRLKKWSYTKYP